MLKHGILMKINHLYRMVFDIFSSLPYTFIFENINLGEIDDADNITKNIQNAKIIRLLRLLKFIKIIRLLKMVKLKSVINKVS